MNTFRRRFDSFSLAALASLALIGCGQPDNSPPILNAIDTEAASGDSVRGDLSDATSDAGSAVTDTVSADAAEATDTPELDGASSPDSLGGLDAACACDDDDPCTVDTCSAGACAHNPAPDGSPCEDGDACTSGDTCVAGACKGGAAKDCSSSNPCVVGACDSAKGCSYEAKVGPCDDGTACTEKDACKDGFCKGAALNCADGNECTEDSCDAVKGCVHTAAPVDTPCGGSKVCVSSACVSKGTLYAHTSSALYKLDLATKTFSLVGGFSFNKSGGSVTDIALDRSSMMYAVTFNDLFTCKTSNAACTWLMKLPTTFNGLTFVHKGTIYKDQDALIGIANDGGWYHVDYKANKLTKLGSYGAGYSSSGDAFSVLGIGTFATVKKSGVSSDVLVEVDPKTGKVLKDLGPIGATNLWGLAWWDGVFYAFSSNNAVWDVDAKSGKGTPLSGFGGAKASWWGAGVSTEAGL